MTQTSINYGRILYELSISREQILESEELLAGSPELIRVLESPLVSLSKKEAVIKRIFPRELTGFFCVVCKYGHGELLGEIFQAYQEYYNEQKNRLSAVLYYVAAPTQEQLLGIKKFLGQKYHAEEVALEMIEDKSLVGGFIIRTKDQEFDYSLKGRINALQQKLTWR